jgi:hypothetical protein
MDYTVRSEEIVPPTIDWDAIYAEVNAWRGECMHHLSAVEYAVTETLLSLSAIEPIDASFKLRHLIGQKLEDLTAVTAPGGRFGEAGKSTHAELLHFRDKHGDFRTLLCHGMAKVTVERSGRWVLVWRRLSVRGRQAERSSAVTDKALALETLDALKRDGTKLASVLGQLRKAVAS